MQSRQLESIGPNNNGVPGLVGVPVNITNPSGTNTLTYKSRNNSAVKVDRYCHFNKCKQN